MSTTVALFLALAATAQQANSPDSTAIQIEALNQSLATAAASGAAGGRLNDLVSQRATLMSQLLPLDPAAAIRLALPRELAAQLRAAMPGSALETQGEWEGTVESVIADDFEHRRSSTRWYLRTPEGRIELFFSGKPPQRPGSKAKISGLRLGNRLAVASVAAEDAAAPPIFTPLGVQKVAVLMITMPSYPTLPENADYFQQRFFGPETGIAGTESLNSF